MLAKLSPHQLTLSIFWIAGGWTFLVWGGRIGLLTGAERADPASWFRIGGSIAFGVTLVFLGFLMWRTESPSGWSEPASFANLVFNLAVWLPSAGRVLTGEATAAFKAVHVALAVTSVGLATAAVWAAGRPRSIERLRPEDDVNPDGVEHQSQVDN